MTSNLIIIEPEKSFNLSDDSFEANIELDKFENISDIVKCYSKKLKTDNKLLIVIHKGKIIDKSTKIDEKLYNSTLVIFKLPQIKTKKPLKITNFLDNFREFTNTSMPISTSQSILLNLINTLSQGTLQSFNGENEDEFSDDNLDDNDALENSDALESNNDLEDSMNFEQQENNVNSIPVPTGIINDLSFTNSIANNVNSLFNNMVENTNMYKDQLETLMAMGFLDKRKNLEALMVTDGNVDLAVNYILQN